MGFEPIPRAITDAVKIPTQLDMDSVILMASVTIYDAMGKPVESRETSMALTDFPAGRERDAALTLARTILRSGGIAT